MKKKINNFTKLFILSMIICLLFADIQTTQVFAASSTYQKAVVMYNDKFDDCARKNMYVKINCDLRDRSGWNVNDKGKKVSLRSFWYSENVRYIFKDVNKDGIPEAFFYNSKLRVMLLCTIYKKQVKLLGVFRTSDFYAQPINYNKKNNVFIITTLITARSTSRNVLGIKNGKLYRLCTLSSYTGSMQPDFSVPVEYWINGKRTSSSTYQRYYKKYYQSLSRYTWGP